MTIVTIRLVTLASLVKASASQLAAIPLFESLSSSDLEELAAWFDVQIASEGVRLIGEGSSGYSFFILTKGSADVTTEEGTVATLGPGDFFGEIAILGDGRRTATVTTTSPSQLVVMYGTEFRRLQKAHPDISGRIAEAMRQRVSART